MPKTKTQEVKMVPVFTRVDPKIAAAVEAKALAARVSVAEYVRWILEDVATGKTQPAHLAALAAG